MTNARKRERIGREDDDEGTPLSLLPGPTGCPGACCSPNDVHPSPLITPAQRPCALSQRHQQAQRYWHRALRATPHSAATCSSSRRSRVGISSGTESTPTASKIHPHGNGTAHRNKALCCCLCCGVLPGGGGGGRSRLVRHHAISA